MENPWKAFQPYDEASAANFKGREENIQELLSIIFQYQSSVCYADSGIGKSSMINAGIKPVLRQRNFLPIDIKFTEQKLLDSEFDFDRYAINRLNEEIADQKKKNHSVSLDLQPIPGVETFEFDRELAQTSLWWVLHTRKIQCHIFGVKTMDFTPVFILDQFEEIFNANVSEEFTHNFFKWYQETISSCMPINIENKIKVYNLDLDILDNPSYKFLLSLRQDAMGSLDYWIAQRLSIPSLRQNHYCLTPLTREQARRVVTEQGVDTLNLVADEIINEIIEKNVNAVPSILLSVFCSRLYDKASTLEDGTKIQVRKEDVYTNRKTLIREFYEYLLAKTNIKEKHVRIIEDSLVSRSTGKRKRIESVHPRLEDIGFNRLYKDKLLNAYLITHTTIEGTEYIEIAHDKVAEAISARQKERKFKKNLNNWRFLLFALPFIMLIASYAYILIPRKDFVRDKVFYWLMRCDVPDNQYVNVKQWGSLSDVYVKNAIGENSGTVSSNATLTKVIVEEDSTDVSLNVRFEDCTNLEELRLSKNIVSIPRASVIDCDNLRIYIHENIRNIHLEAFNSGYLDFEINPHNEHFIWQDGVLWNISDSSTPIVYMREDVIKKTQAVPFISKYDNLDFIDYKGYRITKYTDDNFKVATNKHTIIQSDTYKYAESIDLSSCDTLTIIGTKAFKGCNRLRRIILPPNLRVIESQAFAECVNLKEIVFPENLKEINDYAFANCVKLDSISFSAKSMTSIGKYAFANCQSLTYLQLPSREVSEIDDFAFIDCINLERADFPAEISSSISRSIFSRCNSLNDIRIQEGGYYDNLEMINGCLFHKKYGFILAESDVLLNNTNINKDTASGTITAEDGRVYQLLGERKTLIYYNCLSEGLEKYGFYDIAHPKDSVLRLSDWRDCYFISRPDYLKKIVISLTNPDYAYVGDDGKWNVHTLKVHDIPSVCKKNIDLIVPKGCVDKYERHPYFQGYKSIQENTLWGARIMDITHVLIKGIASYFGYFKWMLPLAILGILMASCVTFLASYQARRDKAIKTKTASIVFALLYTVLAIPVTFIGFYWFLWIICRVHNSVICTLFGILACVVSIIILSAMGQMTFKGLWKNKRQLYQENKTIIWGFIKVAIIIVFAFYSYFIFSENYKDKKEEYINKVYELYEQTDNKAVLFKCLSNRTLSKISISKKSFVPIDTLIGHRNSVNSVALSHDGTKVVTGSSDDTAIIWNADTGVPIDTLKGHRYDVYSVALSHDGTKVVTGSFDDTAIIWNADTGVPIDTLIEHRNSVNSIALSHDGTKVVTGSSDDTAIIWNVDTGVPIATLKGHRYDVNSVALSHDGTKVVTGSSDDDTAIIWNADTGVPIDTLIGHRSNVNSVAISHDGTKIVTGSDDDTAIIWNADTGIPIDTLIGHRNSVNSVALSHDGTKVVTGSDDDTAIIWNADTGVPIDTLIGHRSGVNSVAISHDGTKIVTSSDDDTAIIWGYVKPVLNKNEKIEILRLGFKYDKWYLFVIIGNFMLFFILVAVFFFFSKVKSFYLKIYKPTLIFSSVCLIVLGSIYICKDRYLHKVETIEEIESSFDEHEYDNCINLIFEKLPSMEIKRNNWINTVLKTIITSTIIQGDSKVRAVAISPDNKKIVAGSVIYDVGNKVPIDTLKGHRYDVNSVALSHDGTKIVTGSYDDTPIIWNADTGVPIATLKGHRDNVNSVALSHDGTKVVTGSSDGTAIIWDADAGVPIDTLSVHRYSVTSVALSHDGTKVVTGSSDDTAIIWNADTGVPIATLKGHRYGVNSVALSHDGTKIVTGSSDDTAIIWNAETGTPIDTLRGHSGNVNTVAMSHDCRRIFSGSDDGTVIVWDAETGDLIEKYLYSNSANSLAISDDGKLLVVGIGGYRDSWIHVQNIDLYSSLSKREVLKIAKQRYQELKTDNN